MFKTREGIREIINIFKKEKADITFNQTEKNCYKVFTSIAKQIDEKLLKSKHKYYKYLTNRNTNYFFISPTNSGEVLTVIKELSNNKSARPA